MTDRISGNKQDMLVLVGPTAVGKTELSLTLAERFQCEIISGDSMQVYRKMDIGTAKATSAEQLRIRHHLIDIVEPQQSFSVTDYQRLAHAAIDDIHARGKLPFIVGGTGLYIEAVCYDFQFSEEAGDEEFREAKRKVAAKFGVETLHQELARCDPETAERLHPNDLRRVIRALEVYHLTGVRLSEQLANQSRTSPYRLCIIGLTRQRKQLYERINRRVDAMIEQGLVDEVHELLRQGCHPAMTSMQGLGYKEIASHLMGEFELPEAIDLLKRNTRRFAKRQLSWFRRMKDVHWVELNEDENIVAQSERINAIIINECFTIGGTNR